MRTAPVGRTPQLRMTGSPSSHQQERATWEAGDLARVVVSTVLVGELLCEAVDLRAGQRVLDVATGPGNTAMAAARRRTRVTGVDFVPALLTTARARAEVERLPIDYREGDAEHLPFEDSTFDATLSTFGVMFAADQDLAAREMLRVTRSGGAIGLANWTPEGFLGKLFALFDRYAPAAGSAPSPTRWGTERGIRELLGSGSRSISFQRREMKFRGDSPAAYMSYSRQYLGPAIRAFAALDSARAQELERDFLALVTASNRSGDATLVLPAEYLEIVARRA
jgi:ubiquinone/menaquinone biosynthesis C-methylase UbiE